MKLSIIVPVYNMAANQKLNHCIDSLLNQTIDDYEIIAVDDKSTDNSLEILKDYEKNHPGKVRVVASPENHHQGGARNRGMKVARGKYIGFMDADDWAHPTMFKKLVDKAEATNADMVGCDYNYVEEFTFDVGKAEINNTPDQTGILDEEKYKKHILRSGSMVVKIYLASVIHDNELTFPEDIFYEDNCAAQIWAMYFKHFERVDEPLYYYFTVPESTTHHITWAKCQDRMTAGVLFLEAMKEKGFYEKYKDEIDYRFTELYYQVTLFSYMYSGKNRKLKHVKELSEGIKKYVPDFMSNPYYEKMMASEDKKLIAMHMKSDFKFYWYYILLFTYRNIRKKLGI